MVRRLPWPGPEWRRPFTAARYRVGVILLRPYMDRLWAHYSDASDDPDLPSAQRERCTYMGIGVQNVIRHDNPVGFGHSKYLERRREDLP